MIWNNYGYVSANGQDVGNVSGPQLEDRQITENVPGPQLANGFKNVLARSWPQAILRRAYY